MGSSPFFSSISSLLEGILETGGFLFRTLFYSIEDWLALNPDNALLSWLSGLAQLVGLDWFIEYSFVGLIFSPEGIWTIMTILLVYFMIP